MTLHRWMLGLGYVLNGRQLAADIRKIFTVGAIGDPIRCKAAYAPAVKHVKRSFAVGSTLLLLATQSPAVEADLASPMDATAPLSAPKLSAAPEDSRPSDATPSAITDQPATSRPLGSHSADSPAFVPSPEYAFRSGVLLPWGTLAERNPLRPGTLSEVTALRVPIALELGYRASPQWWFGVHVEAALGPFGDACMEELSDLGDRDCQWEAFRVLLRVERHLSSPDADGFWLGLGAGYESFEVKGTISSDASAPFGIGLALTEKLAGPSLDLDLGYDFYLGSAIRLGPLLTAGANLFVNAEFDCSGAVNCPESGSIDEPELHGWIGLSLKATHGF